MKLFRPLACTILATLAFAPLPSAAQSPAALLQKFQELDANKDNQLTPDELKNKRWFKMLDVDGNGTIQLGEAAQALLALRGGIPPTDEKAADATPATAKPPVSAPVREAPKILNPAQAGIGSLIPDLELPKLSGGSVRLHELTRDTTLVLASVNPTCPVSKRYLPTLATLAEECAAQKATLVLLTGDSPDADLKAALEAGGLGKLTCLLDEKGDLRRALGATASTDAFIIGSARTLVYRGAVDDQYGLGYSREQPQTRYLADALQQIAAGSQPRIAATEAPGCALDLGPGATTGATPTYHGQISRIVQAHCQECHRTGGVAPFPLETLEQVTAKAGMIRKVVERGLMPPWFAATPAKGEHSPWANDRSLAERERTQLLAWLAGGKPAGDPSEAPRPRTFPGEWQIGTPDVVYQIPQPIDVKATGTMPYQNVIVETGLETDRWVKGFEILPTAREVVHHVLVFVQEKGAPRQRDGGGFLAAYVPGNSANLYPDGFAKPLKAGTVLRFQIHYTPNGVATRDQLRLGLKFASEAPERIVRIAEIANGRISIPPHADNHEESATIPVPRDVLVLGLMPHMHVRGKAFRFDAQLPDGTQRPLLEVPRYDFNWQLGYRYATPLPLPSGTRVKATAWYDNSANNPANPDPNATVRWGQQTYEEMMLGYVEYTFAAPDFPRLSQAK